MVKDKMFKETVENLAKLDEKSLAVIKNGAVFLRAKCELEAAENKQKVNKEEHEKQPA